MKITENPHTGITLQGLQTKVREFDVYVKQYLNELADEEEIKTTYANGAHAYVEWLENTLPKLNDRFYCPFHGLHSLNIRLFSGQLRTPLPMLRRRLQNLSTGGTPRRLPSCRIRALWKL